MSHTSIQETPYFAVIFTSTLNAIDDEYLGLDDILIEKAKENSGFIGMDSARSDIGISVSYWKDLESIMLWRKDMDHIQAMQKGKEKWYEYYNVRICKVERNYEFSRE